METLLSDSPLITFGIPVVLGLVLTAVLMTRKPPPTNHYENHGDITNIGHGGEIQINSPTINKNYYGTKNSQSDINEGPVILGVGIAGLMGLLWFYFTKFPYITISIEMIATFSGTSVVGIKAWHYKNNPETLNSLVVGIIFALALYIYSLEAIDMASAIMTENAQNYMKANGPWTLWEEEQQFSFYVLLQIAGLLTALLAMALLVLTSLKNFTLSNSLAGYASVTVLIAVSYFALSGGIFNLLKSLS
ncbi:hypothetical protein [Eilatimonas milleporae]|uniref:Uncharacterized protein n=1 Tax=Eilatimonas milleporae TaxID=911205 RepID=A0A3M0CJU6_9PROT|nr:hypothetical protein [Eilatimonas milleporae]RMB09047.1 hypothetical protein BXY39_1695 [Eilatimonas milleporae]